jgi:hypothetical protein
MCLTRRVRKATVGFGMSVRLFACYNSAVTGRILMKFDTWFSENLWVSSSFIKIWQGQHVLYFVICRWVPISVRNVSLKHCRENQNIFCSVFFSSEIMPFVDDVEEYGKSRQATDDNLIRRRKDVICLLVILRKERKFTVVIFNIYCFSTATLVARTRPSVTLYVHCLSS